MRPSSRLLASLALLVAAIGAVDALLQREWDLLALFLLLATLQAFVVVGSITNRAFITVRPDLARWARQRSQRTGEPVDDVVDRAIALYQHGLYRSDRSHDP